jgi:spore coat polysaccharide biosynthesis predicted glycosyltransferase SpsG/2-polyprenyl-3-methyl-5-hydroxy-6-metoxy-1,4-benzoquinol methylase
MRKKFIINFLTHYSPKVGYGHLNRCLILSKIFLKNKNSVKIYIKKKKNKNFLIEKNITAINNENEMRFADLLIVDTYNFNSKYYKSLKKKFFNIVIFDDFKFITPKFVDGIINYQTTNQKYKKTRKVKYFLGSKYLFLRNEFYKKTNITDKNYIFLTFGAFDQHNILKKFINILSNIFLKKKIYFVTKNKLKYNFKTGNKYKFISNPKNISKLMAKCSFAVSSSGTTIYELLKFKKKIICLSFSKNQLKIAKFLSKKKYLFYAGHFTQSAKLIEEKIKKIKKIMGVTKIKSFKIDKKNIDKLYKELFRWLNSRVNKKKTYEKKTIKNEYEKVATYKFAHQRAKWGSRKNMYGRYEYIKKNLPFEKSKKWLDIGCGEGNLQQYILRENNSLNCTGVEQSKKLFNLSRKKKIKNFKVINHDFNSLKLNNQKFDIITCHGVMAKTNFNLDSFLSKITKTSKVNCKILIDFQNFNWNKFKKNKYRDPRLKWYSIFEIKKILNKHKLFKIEKFKGYIPSMKKEVPLNKAICVFLHLNRL